MTMSIITDKKEHDIGEKSPPKKSFASQLSNFLDMRVPLHVSPKHGVMYILPLHLELAQAECAPGMPLEMVIAVQLVLE